MVQNQKQSRKPDLDRLLEQFRNAGTKVAERWFGSFRVPSWFVTTTNSAIAAFAKAKDEVFLGSDVEKHMQQASSTLFGAISSALRNLDNAQRVFFRNSADHFDRQIVTQLRDKRKKENLPAGEVDQDLGDRLMVLFKGLDEIGADPAFDLDAAGELYGRFHVVIDEVTTEQVAREANRREARKRQEVSTREKRRLERLASKRQRVLERYDGVVGELKGLMANFGKYDESALAAEPAAEALAEAFGDAQNEIGPLDRETLDAIAAVDRNADPELSAIIRAGLDLAAEEERGSNGNGSGTGTHTAVSDEPREIAGDQGFDVKIGRNGRVTIVDVSAGVAQV